MVTQVTLNALRNMETELLRSLVRTLASDASVVKARLRAAAIVVLNEKAAALAA